MRLVMPRVTARGIDITQLQPPLETGVTALNMPLP
jgi:hypothetical protein